MNDDRRRIKLVISFDLKLKWIHKNMSLNYKLQYVFGPHVWQTLIWKNFYVADTSTKKTLFVTTAEESNLFFFILHRNESLIVLFQTYM